MKFSDFKPKHVQGLYSFDHYEAENKAYVQINSRFEGVVVDKEGKRFPFETAKQADELIAKLDY